MNTITQQQAIERVDRYIADAVVALPVDPQLTPTLEQLDGECMDPTDNGPRNRIIVTKGYFLDGIPKDKESNRAYFGALRQWWTSHGFRILEDDRTGDMYLWVENNADGFRMSLQESAEGSVSLGANSPCIWPNGTPVPEP
ncbi:MAG: hypothetical protein ACRDT0_15555 [Pseudonocardiaceae bacterium]